MMSSRYSLAMFLLVGVALIPVIMHGYVGGDNDGMDARLVPAELAGFKGTPIKRPQDWGRRNFDSDDWFSRTYTFRREEIHLTVVRSYDLKSLYHHPELAVEYGTSFVRHEVRELAQSPGMPIHVLFGEASGNIGMYVLRYENEFVSDPMAFQMRTSLRMLISRRKPMTLIFASQRQSSENLESLPATRLLLDAVARFVTDSNGPSR